MSFRFADDFWQAAKTIGDEGERMRFVYSVCAYAFDDVEPSPSEGWIGMFLLMKDRIRKSVAAYEKGKKGGRPSFDSQFQMSFETQTDQPFETSSDNRFETKTESRLETRSDIRLETYPENSLETEKSREELRVEEKRKSIGNVGGPTPQPLPMPTPEPVEMEVFRAPSWNDWWEQWKSKCDERHTPKDEVRALEAFNFYEANGWKQSNGNQIKRWRAALSTCFLRAYPNSSKGGDDAFSDATRRFDQGAITVDGDEL